MPIFYIIFCSLRWVGSFLSDEMSGDYPLSFTADLTDGPRHGTKKDSVMRFFFTSISFLN